MIDKLLNDKKLQKVLELLLLLLVFAMAFTYMAIAFVQAVNLDAAYYLGVIDCIHNGLVPIRDFPLAYTPLSFYLLQLVRFFTHDFTTYIIVLFFVIIIASFVLYKIVYRLSSNTVISLLVQLLFLIQVFYFEGIYFVLEPFVILFGLLSIYFLLKKDDSNIYVLLSGICAGAAFMSKQYGLAFFAGNLIYFIFLQKSIKEKISKILWLCIGFMILPLMFLIYFVLNGVDLWSFIDSNTGGNYGKRTNSFWIMGALKLFDYRYFLTIFLFPLFFILYKKRRLLPLVLLLFVTIGLLTFQFYFNVLGHYYILIIPLILILFSLMFLYDSKYIKLGVIALLFISCGYLGLKVLKNTYYIIKNNPKFVQIQQTNIIQQEIKDSDIVFCLGNRYVCYYYILNKRPPLFSKYGYSFGFDSEERIIEKIKNSTIILVDTKYYDNFIQKELNINYIIRDQFFEDVYFDENITILKRMN